jgi:hypothetical protein
MAPGTGLASADLVVSIAYDRTVLMRPVACARLHSYC